MVCILSSTYSEPLHKIRFYTRAKQIPLRQHCTNCIGLILHRTVTIVSNLNGKTRSSKKYSKQVYILLYSFSKLWIYAENYRSDIMLGYHNSVYIVLWVNSCLNREHD